MSLAGFETQFTTDPDRHDYLRGLWLLWTHLHLITKQSPTTIRSLNISITFFPPRPVMWIVLPQVILHETLHFLIGVFTVNRHIVKLVPPVLDLAYFLSPLLVIEGIVWLPLSLWLFLGSWILLRGALRGDFRPYVLQFASKILPHSRT